MTAPSFSTLPVPAVEHRIIPRMKRLCVVAASSIALLAVCATVAGQPPLFTTSMPKEEFAARRARVMQQIGDGVVVVQGATETSSYEKFRQSNQFYLPDRRRNAPRDPRHGRSREEHDAVPHADQRTDGTLRGAFARAGRAAQELTGIEHVLPRDEFTPIAQALARPRRSTRRFAVKPCGAGTPDREASHAAARQGGSLGPAPSREEWFMSKLREKRRDRRVQESRSHPRRDAHDQEPARDRADSRVHPHRRPGDDGGDAIGRARHARVRDRGDRRLHLQEAQRAGAARTSAWSRRGKNAFWPHYHAAQARDQRRATSCSSTMRPIITTTRRT